MFIGNSAFLGYCQVLPFQVRSSHLHVNMSSLIHRIVSILLLSVIPISVLASGNEAHPIDFTRDWTGLICLVIFVIGYLLVAGEEPLSMKKSKPMLVAGSLIWVIAAIAYNLHGDKHTAEILFRSNIEYYTELFLFLLAAMTFVNAMSERGLFASLQNWLAEKSYSLRQIYWIIGLLTFLISTFVANLAIALLMVTILVGVSSENRKFIVAGSINIVVAANAGGVFTPFGDITSLMVWQQGLLEFKEFLSLGIPALVSWLIPAIVLSFTFDDGKAEIRRDNSQLREGAWVVVLLFALTLVGSVWFESYLHLPAAIGMMTGLGVLKLYGYRLKRKGVPHVPNKGPADQEKQFDIFRSLERSEWDTLMFLLGIVLSIGGLAAMGYLLLTSEFLYGVLGPTAANTLMGLVSAFIENVPLMFSVLGMQPTMDHSQWLLVTLTASVGGSLLSIGSAAGVAVMGQAQGVYTFMSHLRWTWVIALGYAASIGLHFVMNTGSL